jgi:hypothetical protein
MLCQDFQPNRRAGLIHGRTDDGDTMVRWTLMVCILACASTATAQPIGEVWGNLTINWLASERLVYALDVEPKVQVSAVTTTSRFANVEVWPSVEFAVTPWLDAHGEFLTGFYETNRTARPPPK